MFAPISVLAASFLVVVPCRRLLVWIVFFLQVLCVTLTCRFLSSESSKMSRCVVLKLYTT